MKRILVLIVSVICVGNLLAQEAKTLFVNMPDSLTPLLTAVNKADFIDFLESNMKAEVRNKFAQPSEMTDLTTDYIRIQMTSNSSFQMKLLPVNDSIKIVSIVNTSCAPVCDSSIKFFNTQWQELPVSDYIDIPQLTDFFQVADTTQNDAFQQAFTSVDMKLVEAKFSKTDHTITFTLRTPEYMVKEQAEAIQPFLKSPLVYEWVDGKKFQRRD